MEPTNDTDLMSGWVSSASTASLSPLTTFMTPSGRPASFQSAATASAAEGSFSLGLRTTALPQAMAMGMNHIGTMAGKLNGRDDRDDAERLADRVDVDAGRGVLGEAALEQVRDAAGELGDLEAARDLAERVVEDLAVLGGDERGDLLLALVEQLAEGEEHLADRLASEASAHSGQAACGARDDLVDEVGRGEVEDAGLLARGRVEDRRRCARRCRSQAGRRRGG